MRHSRKSLEIHMFHHNWECFLSFLVHCRNEDLEPNPELSHQLSARVECCKCAIRHVHRPSVLLEEHFGVEGGEEACQGERVGQEEGNGGAWFHWSHSLLSDLMAQHGVS